MTQHTSPRNTARYSDGLSRQFCVRFPGAGIHGDRWAAVGGQTCLDPLDCVALTYDEAVAAGEAWAAKRTTRIGTDLSRFYRVEPLPAGWSNDGTPVEATDTPAGEDGGEWPVWPEDHDASEGIPVEATEAAPSVEGSADMKSPGQLAYEADCAQQPVYHDGAPRKAWSDLCAATRDSWERNPTVKPRAPAMVPQPSQQQQGRDVRRGMARCDYPGSWQIGIWSVQKGGGCGRWVARASGPGTIGDGSPQFFDTLAEAYQVLTGEPMPGATTMVPQPCQQAQARDARAPVEASPAGAPVEASDARPVIYFEQDGAFFSYRDRPFYSIEWDAVDTSGEFPGCCPAFACEAPFRVRDFDMAGAEKAAAWFAEECARHGYRAERAPLHDGQPTLSAHPECEAADLITCRDIDRDATLLSEFVALRRSAIVETVATVRPAIVWTRRLRRLARDMGKGRTMHRRDELAERALRAERFKRIAATTRNGLIPLDIGSRDCDGHTTRWRRSIRPSVMAFETLMRGLHDGAEGPVWAYIPERYLARAGLLDSH